MALNIRADVKRTDDALARLRIVIAVRRASPLTVELEVFHILVGGLPVLYGEQITLLVIVSSHSDGWSPLTPCSDDPAVGVSGGRNETGRREELKAKEPHCYCMMAGRE